MRMEFWAARLKGVFKYIEFYSLQATAVSFIVELHLPPWIRKYEGTYAFMFLSTVQNRLLNAGGEE